MKITLNKTIILILSLFLIVSISFATEKISIEKAKNIMSYSLINVVEKKVEQPLFVKVVNENSEAVQGISVIFDVVSFPSSSKGQKVERKIVKTGPDGIASTHFILGSKKGNYSCSARINNQTNENDIVYFKLEARGSKWIFFLVTGVIGGLGLFLFGMNMMSEGMKKSAGNKMRYILSKLTKNRIIALSVGAFVTMIIQSSSATTVMLVSFVQAELMTFAQSLGVILGADIGTTITAQLIAFKLTDYALLMIAIGFILYLFSSKESYKNIGEAILGFGILFLGMSIMSKAMYPLRSYEGFINLLLKLENPLLGVLIGAAFTGIIQSSSAFTGIVIVLASQGLLTLEAGIPLIFGANIGTCITAGLASINTSREAKRVAIAHVIFKVVGVLIFIWWIPTYANFIRSISPVADASLSVIDAHSAVVPRQIANSHTIFNVGFGLIFLPFTTFFAALIFKILPKKKYETGTKPSLWHLDTKVLSTPAMALNLARSETSRMIKILGRMLNKSINPFLSKEDEKDEQYPSLSLIDGIHMRENKIDYLEREILKYLVKISGKKLDNEQSREVYVMMSVVNDIESIADIIDKNILPLIPKKHAMKEDFSEEGKNEISEFHLKASKQISRLKDAFEEMDSNEAVKIMKKETKYEELETELRSSHLKRVSKELLQSVNTHEIHMELMDLLKQINFYTANIAKTIVSFDVPDEKDKEKNKNVI
ncbi:MAG: Na/Pi cotransporter family protein [Candidatus Marinimicrobia bacterium]|nr:Na/Pi cotransporter family protein [Candidatus Neomarinimicrobiota bacterium]